jgi:hypothetical protein
MPPVEFEPTIPVFKRAKTVHALERPATVIGCETLGKPNVIEWNRDKTVMKNIIILSVEWDEMNMDSSDH